MSALSSYMRRLGRMKPRHSLAGTAARGILWALGQNIGYRAIGFLAQLVLARILEPADFGQIGLALTLNTMMMALTDFGIEDVLMSRRKTLALWIVPAYGLSIGLGCLGAALMLLVAPLGAMLFHTPSLIGLVAVLALSAALSGFSTMPNAKLRSDMRFDLSSGYSLAEFVVYQGLTIILAAVGFGAYAFVAPLPVLAVVKGLVFRQLAPVSLDGGFRIARWRFLVGRGGLVFGQRLIISLRDQGDYVLLGIYASQSVVGAYFLGFRLATQPVYALVRSLGVVLFPTLATLAHDPERQTSAAIRAARVLGFVVTPFSFLQAALADPLIRLLFGPEWLPSIPFVQILSIGLAFDVLPCVGGALATARGRFVFQFRAAAGMTLFFLICIGCGVALDGATGVAYGVTASFVMSSLVYSAFAFAPMPGLPAALLRVWGAPVLLSAMAIGFAAAVGTATVPDDQLLARIAATAALGGVAYVAVVWTFARASARAMIEEFLKLTRAMRSRVA